MYLPGPDPVREMARGYMLARTCMDCARSDLARAWELGPGSRGKRSDHMMSAAQALIDAERWRNFGRIMRRAVQLQRSRGHG